MFTCTFWPGTCWVGLEWAGCAQWRDRRRQTWARWPQRGWPETSTVTSGRLRHGVPSLHRNTQTIVELVSLHHFSVFIIVTDTLSFSNMDVINVRVCLQSEYQTNDVSNRQEDRHCVHQRPKEKNEREDTVHLVCSLYPLYYMYKNDFLLHVAVEQCAIVLLKNKQNTITRLNA